MKHMLFGACAALAATTALAGRAQAQFNLTPFSFEARASAALPMGSLKDDRDLETGLALGGEVTYHLSPLLGIYAGYTRTEFMADGAGEVLDQGLDVGVRIAVPTPLIPIDPWIRGGAVYHRFEASGFPANNIASDDEWGFEVGAGIGLGLLPKITITPQASYVSYEYGSGTLGEDNKVEYVKAVVGVRLRL
jgi:hypothetical protein